MDFDARYCDAVGPAICLTRTNDGGRLPGRRGGAEVSY